MSQTIISADDYRLEPAGWRDALAIHRLEQIVFPLDSYSPLEVLFLLLWRGLHNLKAVAPEGGLVGFVSAGRLPVSGKTWIITIGVHPDHQRRGVGRRLLEAAEAALDSQAIYLTVRQSNVRAIQLYERAGYRRVNLKVHYYPGGEDGVEMRKDRL